MFATENPDKLLFAEVVKDKKLMLYLYKIKK